MKQPKNFGFGEEATMLKDSARKFFSETFPGDELHRVVAADSDPKRTPVANWRKDLWQQVVELGWSTVAVPEAAGGLGMSAVAVAGLVEEAGRAAFPSPLLETINASYILTACNTENAVQALGMIIDGKAISLAFSDASGSFDWNHTDVSFNDNRLSGTSYFVQDAAKADYFLVKACHDGGIGLFMVDADSPGVSIIQDAIVDLTRDQARVHFNEVEVKPDYVVAETGIAVKALNQALPALLTMVSADICGASEWLLQTTAEYAQVRKQFDRPIGFFQAVKHPLVDLMIKVDGARSLTYNAACAIDHEPERALEFALMAKSQANEAAIYGSNRSVQLHGGIGYTWECFVQIYFKRQFHSQAQWGSASYQREQLARLLINNNN